ncbi:Carbon monoxide dehydrogenase subunit G (CoxG) [Roseovarius albus]|uniref:Carbon monoxide dehydrogenase subunit G (CoxG) n=1 Tax=Roseovarius albus TaxID=1247867 RepID=A0A1X7A5C7_9RHOB|nr:carbon monoxide dehydrogenase subunit G [Roseovarius albus]SLN71032.1 Carbon monoxide dehydrogenase subunit G (CoxG) [Roseovarius albus]
MQMNGEREIHAARSIVWAALQNPEVLKACVHGTQELTGSVEDGFDATVQQKVGPVKATFRGIVTFSDIVEQESITLTGEGKGGAAGHAKGAAKVHLSDTEDGTLLTYDVEAKVGGKIAQLGSRIVDGFAKKMADRFFTNLEEIIEGPKEHDSEEDAERKGWLNRLIS